MKMLQGKFTFKGMMAAGLCLGIAGFAVYSITLARGFFAPQGDTVALQASHDPLQNGLRIDRPNTQAVPRVTRTDGEPTVALMDNLIYTDNSGSGGNGGGGGCGENGEQPEGNEATPSVP